MEDIAAQGRPSGARDFDPRRTARHVLRTAMTGALATSAADGHPFASLVTVATTMAGEPALLLSDLAQHTQNLQRDSRASLLLVAGGSMTGDPLAAARLSVAGRVLRADGDDDLAGRFLTRHPEARNYSGFADFSFYRLAVTGAHLVAGFGRIVDLAADDLLVDLTDCAALAETAPDAVAHMNADHRDAVRLYATELCGAPDGRWRITGLDPSGADLVSEAGATARLDFPERIATPKALRTMLIALAEQARA
jgi:heme iron utilization protein